MKFFLIGLFTYICTYYSFAQKPEVKWGAIIDKDDKNNEYKILGSDDKSIYVFKFDYGKKSKSPLPCLLTLYKSSLAKASEIVLPLPSSDDGVFHFENAFFTKGKLVLFITQLKTKNGRDGTYACIVNKDGSLAGKYKMVVDNEGEIGYKLGEGNVPNLFKVFTTSDSSKFVVCVRRSDKRVFHVTAIDYNLTTIWSDSIDMAANGEANGYPTTIGIDDNTNFLIASDDSKSNSKSWCRFRIYDHEKKKINIFEINYDKKSDPINLHGKFYTDKQGRTCYASNYGKSYDHGRGEISYQKGVELLTFNGAGIEKEFRPFSKAARLGYMSKSEAEKSETIIDMDFRDIVLNDDGSYKIIVFNSTSGTGKTAIIKYDKKNTEQWTAFVPENIARGHAGELRSYQSSAIFKQDDDLYFLYNDQKKNIDRATEGDAKILWDIDDGVNVIVHVTGDGVVKKQLLSKSETTLAHLIPTSCIQSGNNEMLLLAKKKNDVQFGRLVLN